MDTTPRGRKPNPNGESSFFINILEKCKHGATKRDIITTIRPIALSNAQFRRSTAELVDKRLLSYDRKQHVFITTDKGILFLNRAKKTSNII